MLKIVCCIAIITGCLTLWPSGEAAAKSFPKDGRFKQLEPNRDPWYYIDHKNWYIKAPDKWTHFAGSYALAEVAHRFTGDKAWAGVIALGLGVLKEVDDARREGWSKRDLYMDIGGVAASVLLPDNMRLLAYYDDTVVMWKLSLVIR